jgi:hypothetical protein
MLIIPCKEEAASKASSIIHQAIKEVVFLPYKKERFGRRRRAVTKKKGGRTERKKKQRERKERKEEKKKVSAETFGSSNKVNPRALRAESKV